MTTLEKGDAFELKSVEIIKKVIERGDLGLIPNMAKICEKKKYYSKLRDSNVILDLTIEVWPPNATRFSMLYIIECKDYKIRVPVSKIDDFYTRIVGIGGVRSKGIFISNTPLQKGAMKTAENTGMMVIQAVSNDDYKIVLHKTAETFKRTIPVLNDSNVIVEQSEIDDLEPLENLIDSELKKAFVEIFSDQEYNHGLDILSKDSIGKFSEEIFKRISLDTWERSHALTVEQIKDFLNKEYNVNIITLDQDSDLLGRCDFEKNEIGISPEIYGSPRELFILCHEVGHYFLHNSLTVGQNLYESFDDYETGFKLGRKSIENPRQWIEWQANCFASSLIMPREIFITRLVRTQKALGLPLGKIHLNHDHQFKPFNVLLFRLSELFNVTKTSIIYKLREFDMLHDNYTPKPIGEVLRNFLVDFEEY